MIGILSNIFEIFTNIPLYIMFAVETLINLFFTAIEGLFLIAILALGELPEVGAPEFIEQINWFFPIGSLLAIAAPIVVAYVSWLGVSWIFHKMGEL